MRQDSKIKAPTYVVYAAYAYADVEAGQVISRHKTPEAAEKKVMGSTFWAIRIED